MTNKVLCSKDHINNNNNNNKKMNVYGKISSLKTGKISAPKTIKKHKLKNKRNTKNHNDKKWTKRRKDKIADKKFKRKTKIQKSMENKQLFGKLRKCKGCQSVFYCCINHQKKDWLKHRLF